MNESDLKIDQYLFQLILSLQMAAMQNMGKIMSPVTGKVERNLEQARVSIDMLNMLSEKTKGNLNDEENKFLSNILHELRLNFMDEMNKPEPAADKKDDDADAEPETTAKSEEKPVSGESDRADTDDPEK